MTEIPLDIETNSLPIDQLRAGVEAILLVADEPLEPVSLAATLGVATGAIEAAFTELADDLAARDSGIELRRVAGGFRLYTAESVHDWVERYVRDGQVARLTQAALETLAVIAYKQPVTRARVSAIRGVNVDSVVRTLETRGLVEQTGAESDTGAILFRTTNLFLEKLGLSALEDLPSISNFLPDLETSVDLGDAL